MRPADFFKYPNVARRVQKVGHPCPNMYNVLKENANIEINEKFFCYFQLPKSISDFWLNALALMMDLNVIQVHQ